MIKKYYANQIRDWEDELEFRYDLFASESDEDLRKIARVVGIEDCEHLTRRELIDRLIDAE